MYDVVIIGCGCAGISAAIYAKRSNMKVVVIENDSPGGQINKSSIIENYPGFESIDGPSLAYHMFSQINKLKIEYRQASVTDIKIVDNQKIVITDKGEIITKTIIIATGRKPRKLNIENEEKLTGRGISWCAICDGSLYKDKNVVVIGGGNSAIEESLYLSEIANKVTIINRSDNLRADAKFRDELKNRNNIEIMYNYKPIKYVDDNNHLVGINIQNTVDRDERHIKTDGAFVFIGYEPVSGFCSHLGIVDEDGYILVNDKMETKVDGIYACGDIIKKDLYQIVTSISEGAIAATNAKKHVD